MLNQREEKLKEMIFKSTVYFKHRPNFEKWQEMRLWQENYQEQEISFLERFVPDLKSKKILDLGCGMGGFLVAMQRRGYDIVGLEFNVENCEITKLRGERYDQDAMIVNSSGEKMPFKDNSFDFIHCNDVLEHCENPLKFLEESCRVLKPGGQMYITIINRFGFKDPHYHLRFVNWMPRVIAERYITWLGTSKDNTSSKDRQKLSEMHYFTFGKFQKLAGKIGFEVRDLIKYKIFHPELISPQRIQKTLRLLNSLRISSPIYYIARLFYLSGFRVMLKKTN